MNSLKLVVFDLAGTTVRDTNSVGKCLQDALAEVGVEATLEDVNSIMGMPKPLAIRELLDRHGKDGNVDAIHDRFQDLMIEYYRTSPEVGEIETVSELFGKLKENGLMVAVDTGFDRGITRVLLERMSWDGLVDASITSDEVDNGRPYPDMIFALCDRLGVTPAETVKVGDTPVDIQEGLAAKAAITVGVTYGTHTADQLRAHHPDALIDEPLALLPIVL